MCKQNRDKFGSVVVASISAIKNAFGNELTALNYFKGKMENGQHIKTAAYETI